MEKEQLDSLATVAVGSEKIPPPHSHYAPSEMYSSSESPPAYSRPGKSTAVQITKIIATSLLAISFIIGSFILAAAWLQARASCTHDMDVQAQMNFQHKQDELFKHLQPEALVQDPIEAKESISRVVETTTTVKPIQNEKKSQADSEDNKTDKAKGNDSENENENETDYDDSEFSPTPVHIKLPLRLDLDDLAGTLMQHARNLVTCVVEHRKADDFSESEEEINNNANERGRPQRLRGERVTILCESEEPRERQEPTIIIPLGANQVPMQSQEAEYNRYQIQNQFPAPENQRSAEFTARGMNQMEQAMILPQIRAILNMVESGQMGMPAENQQREAAQELPQIPIKIIRDMRPPMDHEHLQQIPIYTTQEQPTPHAYNQEQQAAQGMMPPPPPPPSAGPIAPENEPRIIPQVIIRQQSSESQESPEKQLFPFIGLQPVISKIFEQVPVEVENFIHQMTRGMKPLHQLKREPEQVQEFKPFPMNAQPMLQDSYMPQIQLRPIMEQGNMEMHRPEMFEGRKPYPTHENQEEKPNEEDKFRMTHQALGHPGFPLPRFALPLRPIDSLDGPTEMTMAGHQENREDKEEPQEDQHGPQPAPAHPMPQSDELDAANRPHFVQPRSVRSIPDASIHPREKRTRR